MSSITIKSTSADETLHIAEVLAQHLNPGDIIALEGTLGVGKTVFAKGIAAGLGVEEPITSPTFTIIKEYGGENIPFYHIDAYRLEHSDEDIGFEEYFYSDGVGVIEWAQFIDDYLPNDILEIKIDYISENSRSLTFTATDNYYQTKLKAFKQAVEQV